MGNLHFVTDCREEFCDQQGSADVDGFSVVELDRVLTAA